MTDTPSTDGRGTGPGYAFGPFRLDPSNRRLTREGHPITITGRPLEILLVLVEHAGRPVDKATLLDRVWGNVAVEEGNLARNVSTLRKVLGDTSEEPSLIATIPGRGYQFIAPVRVLAAEPNAAIAPSVAPTPPRPRYAVAPEYSSAPGHGFRGPTLVIVPALIVLLLGGWGFWRADAPAVPPGSIRLAVLPFQNLTGTASQDYIVDGLTDELIAALGRLNPGRLTVVARTSAAAVQGPSTPLAQLREALNARYVVEGSVRRSADRFRVTAQLIDATSGSQLWSQSYERDGANVLAVQQDLAQSIAREIRIDLVPDAAATRAQVRVLNMEAYRLYQEGRRLLTLATESDIRRALERFSAATALDPGYAPAYAGTADAAVALTEYYVDAADTIVIGRAAARRAVELDDSLAAAHASLATVHLLFDWDWTRAEDEYRRALDLNPGYADAHGWYGYYLALMGRTDEAVAQVRIAESLDPISVAAHLNAGWVYYLARRNDEAQAQVRKALQLDPQGSPTHSSLWVAYVPIPEFVRRPGVRAEHATSLGVAVLAGAAATLGETEEAERLLSRLRSSDGYVCPYELATAYSALGKRDEAFKYLEASYREHSPCLPDLGADPRFDALHGDPRFASLLERLNLGASPAARQ
ncbi:MAG TPA: winged helix-turn-helix domain-containing protein [Vicinamibacterales bacterium]|nr:winged helix-turn-helix domain-containing protein [Vicinamibacterales bacterium]